MVKPTPQELNAAKDPSSRAEVVIVDNVSCKRWADALGVTDEALAGAVQAVGPRVDRIKEYLGAGGMAAEQIDG